MDSCTGLFFWLAHPSLCFTNNQPRSRGHFPDLFFSQKPARLGIYLTFFLKSFLTHNNLPILFLFSQQQYKYAYWHIHMSQLIIHQLLNTQLSTIQRHNMHRCKALTTRLHIQAFRCLSVTELFDLSFKYSLHIIVGSVIT